MERVGINGVQVFPFESRKQILNYLESHKGILVAITARKILNATDDTRAIINNNIGYCDGQGAVLALKRKGYKKACQMPGCELWLNVVEHFAKSKKFYLIGSKQSVIEETVSKLHLEYPQINIVGFRNGYINSESEKKELIKDILEKRPDIIFVAMGSPKQEFFMRDIQKQYDAIYQGLGGSFDVYTGNVKRAPEWWVNHRLESLYRLLHDPKRIKRQAQLFRFIWWMIIGKI